MAGAVRIILQIVSVVVGVIMLQTPIYWVAHRHHTVDNNEMLPNALDSLQLSTLKSKSEVNSIEPVQSPRNRSESRSLKTESTWKVDPIQPKNTSFRPLSVPHHAFVLFNTYRYSLKSFYVIGTTSVVVRKFEQERPPVYRCEWVPSNGSQFEYDKSIMTEAQMLYVGFDENSETYVPAVVNCTFNQTVGGDNLGGLLRFHLSKGPSFWEPHFAIETIFEEKVQSLDREFLVERGDSPLQHKYAFCGPPIHSGPSMQWIQKWLGYHHLIWQGNIHFYFYDVGGIDDRGREMLAPWVKSGLLTIVNALGEENYPSWYKGQVLYLNDCLYRARFHSQWVFFQDLDEFIHIPAPKTLESLLEEYKDVPWMSFASIPADLDHCRKARSADEWPLERTLWRNKEPECRDKETDPWNCLAAKGRRKVVVNPQKVMLVGVHKTALPESDGIDFNGTVARLYHFHGALNPSKKPCGTIVSDNGPEHLQLDDSLASRVRDIRKGMDTQLRPEHL